jgi:hypothetical protein
VGSAAEAFGKRAVLIDNGRDDLNEVFIARWVLVSGRREFFDDPEVREASKPLAQTTSPAWTDDYSNLFRVLKKY